MGMRKPVVWRWSASSSALFESRCTTFQMTLHSSRSRISRSCQHFCMALRFTTGSTKEIFLVTARQLVTGHAQNDGKRLHGYTVDPNYINIVFRHAAPDGGWQTGQEIGAPENYC